MHAFNTVIIVIQKLTIYFTKSWKFMAGSFFYNGVPLRKGRVIVVVAVKFVNNE